MVRSVLERRELGNTGIEVCPISLGGSPLGNEFGVIDVSFDADSLDKVS